MKIIEFFGGECIDDAWNSLQQQGEPCEGQFNNATIYSTDTLDEAYQKVTGITKAEFEAKIKASDDEYERQEKEHEALMPTLIQDWIEKGKNFLDEKYWKKWAACVPVRLDDLYKGMELAATQEILEILNKSENLDDVFEEANAKLNDQGHSGMSYGLMMGMIRAFHDNGKEFVNRLK